MKSLSILKKEAMESCEFRGHKMGAWIDGSDRKTSECQCSVCDAWVVVETKPMANGIDIGGPAVAVGCEDAEKHAVKTFNDNFPGGKEVELTAELVGVYTDSNGTEWNVYRPISSEWQGVYHLVPIDGGESWIPTCLDERRIIAAWEATILAS